MTAPASARHVWHALTLPPSFSSCRQEQAAAWRRAGVIPDETLVAVPVTATHRPTVALPVAAAAAMAAARGGEGRLSAAALPLPASQNTQYSPCALALLKARRQRYREANDGSCSSSGGRRVAVASAAAAGHHLPPLLRRRSRPRARVISIFVL